ncbi:OmpA family protein [Pseudoroseicyclus sp. CXY001]|uniref:OmpA family protein n=1 Tax=Pseudoroseicyclus sp. CXY001 TaxID=3242492 RepID=UPI0035711D47
MRRAARLGGLLAVLLAGPALAQTLSFPEGAVMTAERQEPEGSYALPLGPAEAGVVPTRRVEGALTMQAWRLPETEDTLALLAPLREQILAAGFTPLLDCETSGCGGFDFRLAVELLPAPDFWFDLGDFRAFAAEKEAEEEALVLVVSHTAGAGYVHLARIGPASEEAALSVPAEAAAAAPPASPADFDSELEARGRVILADLSFETGSAQLGPGPYASLQALARYLAAHPGRQVALVGHTDSEGGLEPNITLSRRRAGSVLERLVSRYGTPRSQLAAEGMGYLAPVASNLTPGGREANRRVEVILTSTE